MRCFSHIAKLIRTKRINHPKGYSQSELSNLLGYKNGQFISNVERALCNIPLKMLGRVCEVLDISTEELKSAILRDQEITLNNYLKAGAEKPQTEASNAEGFGKSDVSTTASTQPYSFKSASGDS